MISSALSNFVRISNQGTEELEEAPFQLLDYSF